MNISLLIALLLQLLGGTAGSGAIDPTGHAAGGVTFRVGTATGRATFSVFGEQGGRAPSGQLYYQETLPNGHVRFFRMRVTRFGAFPDAAGMRVGVFSGPVEVTNDQVWRGKFMIVSVLDGGSPGAGNDLISFRTSAINPATSRLAPVSRLQVWLPVRRGDLVVR